MAEIAYTCDHVISLCGVRSWGEKSFRRGTEAEEKRSGRVRSLEFGVRSDGMQTGRQGDTEKARQRVAARG
jgi:hypothetical protein